MNNEIRIGNFYIKESEDIIYISYKRPIYFYLSIGLSLCMAILPIILLVGALKSIGDLSILNLVLLFLNNAIIQLAVAVALILFIYLMRYTIKKALSPSKEIFVIDLFRRTLELKFSDLHKTELRFDDIEQFWLIGNTDEKMLEDGERFTETYCILNIHLKGKKEIIEYKFEFDNLFTKSNEANTIKVCQQLVKYISSKCEHIYTWRYNKTSSYVMENLK